MSGRRTFPQKVERGEAVAAAILAALFRVVAFLVFAPVAVSAWRAGDTWGVVLALAFGLGLGAVLAPRD